MIRRLSQGLLCLCLLLPGLAYGHELLPGYLELTETSPQVYDVLWKLPLTLAAALVAVFALFHGYAHGRELPDGADALLFSLAFVASTGLLHLLGILLGELRRWPLGYGLIRVLGGGIAVIGFWFLLQAR